MSVDVSDAETYAVYSERAVRARKEHRCDACKRPIERGSIYIRVFMVWDCTAESIKRCPRCELMHLHLRSLDTDHCELWPAEKLDCGMRYEEEWGDLPDDVAWLAFATNEEAGERLLGLAKTKGFDTETPIVPGQKLPYASVFGYIPVDLSAALRREIGVSD